MERSGGNQVVLAYGEILWDVLPHATVLGGAPFNLAYRLQTLGETALFASRVGADKPGRDAIAEARRLGMTCALIQSDPEHATGLVHIGMAANGDLDIDIVPDAAYDFIAPTPELMRAAETAACICFGTVAQRSAVSRETLYALLDTARKATRLLDINLRPRCYSEEVIKQSLERAEIVKVNETEAEELAGMFRFGSGATVSFAREMISRWNLECCIVTLGERGAIAVNRQGDEAMESAPAVSVVDALGAGDAFTAGFLHRYLRGSDLSACCRFGNALGAMVAAQPGATGPTNLNEID